MSVSYCLLFIIAAVSFAQAGPTDIMPVYNICPNGPSQFDFLTIEGRQICLGMEGVGVVDNNQCHYFDIPGNTAVSYDLTDTQHMQCRIQNHPNLLWEPITSLSSAEYNFATFPRFYVKTNGDSSDFTLQTWLCKGKYADATLQAQNPGEFAGSMTKMDDKTSPLGKCRLPLGEADPQSVNVLRFKVTRELSTLWNQLTPLEIDPGASSNLAEGAYALAATAEACRDMCQSVGNCGAFLWYSIEGHCWMKIVGVVESARASPPTDSDTIRGMILDKGEFRPDLGSCPLTSDIRKGTIYGEGNIFNGGLLQSFDKSGPECCQLCKDTPDCKAITWLQFEKQCFLFNTAGRMDEGPGDAVCAIVA